MHDFECNRGIRQAHNHNAKVLIQWIPPHIREIHAPRDQRSTTLTRSCGDLLVRRRPQPNVSCKLHLMPSFFQRRNDCAR